MNDGEAIRYAGVDVSTKAVDIVILDDLPRWIHVDLGDGLMLDRVRRIHARVDGQWEDVENVQVWGVERPFGRFGAWQTSMALGGVLQCFDPLARVEWFAPSSWRKICGIPGGSSKGSVRAWVETQTDCGDWSQDACDAFCVAVAVRHYVEELAGAEA